MAAVFQIQSFLVLSLMVLGIYLHRKRNLHPKIMAAVILWDIVLILQIELSRSAIDKASKMMSNPAILNIHVAFAVSTVLLYPILARTGYKMLKGKGKFLPRHKLLGYLALVLRAMTFATSFFVK